MLDHDEPSVTSGELQYLDFLPFSDGEEEVFGERRDGRDRIN